MQRYSAILTSTATYNITGNSGDVQGFSQFLNGNWITTVCAWKSDRRLHSYELHSYK